MTRETRTNLQIFDHPGTLSGAGSLEIDVRFDLIELEDLAGGIPAGKFSYGVLRFEEQLHPSVEALLLSTSKLTLTGRGIEATLCLYDLNSFTVVRSREISEVAAQVPA